MLAINIYCNIILKLRKEKKLLINFLNISNYFYLKLLKKCIRRMLKQ